MAYGKGFELHISIPSELLRYFVPKGSVAVDGVSLTVADICNNLLVVAVIPHTCYVTTLSENKVGDKVNIEVDLLSKYIERQLQRENPSSISEDMLLQAGILPMGWIDN
jgi:riboflavin synthase